MFDTDNSGSINIANVANLMKDMGYESMTK